MNNEIESFEALLRLTKENKVATNKILQSIDLEPHTNLIQQIRFSNCIFLGCSMENKVKKELLDTGNLLFPKLENSFNAYRSKLYNKETLYKDFDKDEPDSYKQTIDYQIYQEYLEKGREGNNVSIQTSLARRLHDHAISDALFDYINKWDSSKIVAIMGGHSLSRQSEDYKKVLFIAKNLAENNHLLISGGGPGAMEATHLGAWMAFRKEKEVKEALAILSKAPSYNHNLWLSTAFDILDRYPRKSTMESLAIPTWFYGHEPSTPFATHIAKYFANSVREEGLLAIAKGGIIFSPGSAGTIQEIFQEATQNHYKTYGNVSPMIFLNKKYWTKTKPVYPLLKRLAKGLEYEKLLSISSNPNSIIKTIIAFTNN